MSATIDDVERDLMSRWPESRLAPSLDRMTAAMTLLGQPQTSAPAVHITGTNGKTSTARMIDHLLRATGRRTGRYTSPHLASVRERLVIDGAPVSEELFVAAYRTVLPAVREVEADSAVPMSFFEVITTMAYAAFARAGVDALVIEVGMGGTWDATNVVDGEVAVVTPISLDHMEYLGVDHAAIAHEKTGIIKAGCDVVLARQPMGAEAVLRARAHAVGARVHPVAVVGRRPVHIEGHRAQMLEVVTHGRPSTVPLHLLGPHQAENAAVALSATEAFLNRRGEQLTASEVRAALPAVRTPGRLEVVTENPVVVVDASYNPAGMATSLTGLLETLDVDRMVVVLAMLLDKDAAGVVGALAPVAELLIVTTSDSPRALPPAELETIARSALPLGQVIRVEGLAEAVALARVLAAERRRTGVLITGSVVASGLALGLMGG